MIYAFQTLQYKHFKKTLILQKNVFRNPGLLDIISFNYIYVSCDNSSSQTPNVHIKPLWQSFEQLRQGNN